MNASTTFGRMVTCGSVSVLTLLAGAGMVQAQSDSTTWYVSAAAAPGGRGDSDSPFNSLASVEAAARDGDTIVVRAVAPRVPPLDGGIALKPGQTLVGEGAPVIGASDNADLPRISNTTANHDGDAVRLATGAQVRNLVIDGARRGGIYGSDAADTVITGNVVTGTNQQCADGFMIGPFSLPPTIALGVAAPALPNFITLNNGWAAIMTDFSAATGTVRIDGNSVHDTACGDGIDLRAHGTSRVSAELTGNALRNINLGLAKLSVLAMGVQAGGDARLTATLSGNSQLDIAPPASSVLNELADSEGVFINPLGRAHLDVSIDHNEFRNGAGNFSANGLEYVTTSGTPDSRVTVSDSSFDTVRGDIIENYNLSTDGARQSLTLDRVHAFHSTFPGGALNPLVPANLGTCLVTTNFGRAAHTDLTVTNSDFGDCSADGIGLIGYTPTGSGPATAELVFDIRDTTVTGTAANGLAIINVGETAVVRGTVARTDISGAQQSLIHARGTSGQIADAAVEFNGVTLDGTPGCPVAQPRVEASGIPLTCRP